MEIIEMYRPCLGLLTASQRHDGVSLVNPTKERESCYKLSKVSSLVLSTDHQESKE